MSETSRRRSSSRIDWIRFHPRGNVIAIRCARCNSTEDLTGKAHAEAFTARHGGCVEGRPDGDCLERWARKHEEREA